MEETISLQEILKIIKKRLLLIISLTIVTVCIAVVLNFYVYKPAYYAETQILVNQNGNSEQIYSSAQIQTDLQLINTYNDIIGSPYILSKVIEELNLDKKPEQLTNQTTLYSKNDSKVLYIGVTDANPEKAAIIANKIADVFKKEIPLLMNVDNINILSVATLSDNPTPISPNKERNLAVGAVIGILLGLVIAFLLELLDTSIKDEKDVEEILGLPIMGLVGSIPLERERKSSFKSHKVRSKRDALVEK